MNFANAMTVALKARGWSTETLATMSGLDIDYLYGLEDGGYQPVGDTLERIAAAIGVPVNSLLLLGVEDDDKISISKELREQMQVLVVALIKGRE